MTTYRIRAWVGQGSEDSVLPQDIVRDDEQNATEHPDFKTLRSLRNVWVEIWDKDERFDDHLGRGRTNSAGIFEVEFTDEDFRQDILELEWYPDLFARIYRGRQLLFTTEGEGVLRTWIVRKESGTKDESGNIIYDTELHWLPHGGIQWNVRQWEDEDVNPRQHLAAEETWGRDARGDTGLKGLHGLEVVDDDTETNYRIEPLNAWRIPEPPPQPTPPEKIEIEPYPGRVVDVLPSLDQIAISRSGASTALNTGSNGRRGSLEHIVDSAFGSVLCRNPKDDPQVFLDSLTKSFIAQEDDGRTNYIWNPCSYGTRIETDLGGAITGAQASLYHRTKTSLEDALRLLDGLKPLNPAADPQNMEAVRSTVRTEILELINEMGLAGGARVQRVDSLFQILIGDTKKTDSYEIVGGQLQDLADTFGLTRSRINTVEEEQNYSNYLIIRDYLISLRTSWDEYSTPSGAGAYVGTQLTLLSQALSVVAESVHETYQIMDLFFLGSAERQSVWLDFTQARLLKKEEYEKDDYETGPQSSFVLFNRTRYVPYTVTIDGEVKELAFWLPDGTPFLAEDVGQLTPPMNVEELLSWVMRFATEEGPTLAMSGGKLGIANPLAEIANKLMILTTAASHVPVNNTAFRREGVTRALRDVGFHCYQVKRLAQELIPPITSLKTLDAYDPKDASTKMRLGAAEDSETMRRLDNTLREFQAELAMQRDRMNKFEAEHQ